MYWEWTLYFYLFYQLRTMIGDERHPAPRKKYRIQVWIDTIWTLEVGPREENGTKDEVIRWSRTGWLY